MKNIRILFLLFITTACSRQNTQKLNFIKNNELDFEQIQQMAQQKQKLIFVDVYATWCGPCKWMDENTFKNEAVANKLNYNFINYKVDAESFSGISLTTKYNVDAYPTYLFLNEKGTIVKRIEGMMYPESFLKEVDEIIKK